jgi:hypothetical protein
MKKNLSLIYIVLLCLSLPIVMYAQDDEKTQTLLGGKKLVNTGNLGIFIPPSYGFTQMDGSSASLFNLRGGVSWNEKLSFGGYIATSLNQINPESEKIQGIYMDYWSVGGFAEYTLHADKLFHVYFPVYIGYGEVGMDNDAGLGDATFFQIVPETLLEVNVHKNVRFNLGAGYRFEGDMEYRNFNQADLSGITGYVGLNIGLLI